MSTGVVVTHAHRTAVGKSGRGTLRETRPDELLGRLIETFMERVPDLDPADVDDVIVGCAFPEAEQGMNVARIAALRAGLPVSVPGMTLNRFCSSGLRMFDATTVGPGADPAPRMVWISSMKRMGFSRCCTAATNALKRASKSPR